MNNYSVRFARPALYLPSLKKSEKPDDMWLDFDGFTTRLEKLLSDHSSDSK